MEKQVDPKQTRPAYKCKTCNKEYMEAEADELMKMCCGKNMTKLEIAYRSSPSPTGA